LAGCITFKVSHAAIETHAIAAIAIMNQKPWRPPIPRAAFDDLLGCPLGRRMPCNFDVEDLSIGKPNHEEDIERLE
jgi:hypothetical protein